MRNVKDPDPLCLALNPTPFRFTLTRARTHTISPNYPGEVGETPPSASRRPRAQHAYLLPAARRRKEATEAAKKGRIQKKAHEEKEEKSGGETQEGEGGGERREMKSLSEHGHAGEGKDLGWEKAGGRIAHRQVESGGSEGKLSSPSPPPLRRRKVCTRHSPVLLAAALGGVGESHWPSRLVLGDLAPLSSLLKSSWIQALQALAFARALTPGLRRSLMAFD